MLGEPSKCCSLLPPVLDSHAAAVAFPQLVWNVTFSPPSVYPNKELKNHSMVNTQKQQKINNVASVQDPLSFSAAAVEVVPSQPALPETSRCQ